MKHKTLFRLLVKLLGVYFIIAGSVAAARMAMQIVFALTQGTGMGAPYLWLNVLYSATGLLELAAGLYLFFGGRWVVDRAIPSNRPYCPECGYDLRGAAAGRCPECGTVLPAETIHEVQQQNLREWDPE